MPTSEDVLTIFGEMHQKRKWEELERNIRDSVGILHTKSVKDVVSKLLKLDLLLGRGILASEILNAQRRNKGNESVYADLVSEINVHCPCVTKLIIVRLVLRLKNCLANKRKVAGLSTAVFIGQLIKSSVITKMLVYEILDCLLDGCSNYGLEVAAAFLSQCVQKFAFERRKLCTYIEKMNSFACKNGTADRTRAIYSEFLDVYKNMELPLSEDFDYSKPKSITHQISLNDVLDPEYERDTFQFSIDVANGEAVNIYEAKKRRRMELKRQSEMRREEEISRLLDYKFKCPDHICSIRWNYEVRELQRDPPPGISVGIDERTKGCFDALVAGPEETPYARGLFRIKMWLPPNYPFEAPAVRFITKIFHPNVDRHGRVCSDCFTREKWSSAMNIYAVLLTIQSLMYEPDLDHPLCPELANLWKTNSFEAKRLAKEYTRLHAFDA